MSENNNKYLHEEKVYKAYSTFLKSAWNGSREWTGQNIQKRMDKL